MKQQTTLEQVQEWLSGLDPEQVVYFESLELRHCLMAAYYQSQGYGEVMVEYDRVRRAEGDRAVIGTFASPLPQFLCALHATPLRYTPTAGALLAYLSQPHAWQSDSAKVGQCSLFCLSPEQINALYDGPLRPATVSWRHVDLVEFAGETCKVLLTVQAPSLTDRAALERSLPYDIDVEVPASAPPSLLEELRWLRVRHHHVDGRIGTGASDADRRGLVYHVSCLSSLEEGAKVELLVWGKDARTLGTWQSRGGKLIRVG